MNDDSRWMELAIAILVNQRGWRRVRDTLRERGRAEPRLTTVIDAAVTAPRSLLLHSAARSGQTATVELMLARGGHADSCDREGRALIDRSIWRRNGASALHIAAAHGHGGCVDVVLARGGDVNGLDADAQSPLHAAAADGHATLVVRLLAAGASIAARNRESRTPLNCAAFHGHESIVALLVDNGADFMAPDADGWTPIKVARQPRLHLDRRVLERARCGRLTYRSFQPLR